VNFICLLNFFLLDLSSWRIYAYVFGIIIYLLGIFFLIIQPVNTQNHIDMIDITKGEALFVLENDEEKRENEMQRSKHL